MIFAIEGVGVWGAGYAHWNELLQRHPREPARVASADADTGPSALPASGPKPEIIPARERRRAPLAVKLAVEVASQAFEQTDIAASDTACVFASGMGDTSITDHMCRAVATADKLLSPTKFHNSVHNAAAGYWSISTGCMMPANSISAFNYTAALALLEAGTQCQVQQRPILLVLFDTSTPATFAGSMTVDEDFAAALLLSPGRDDSRPAIEINMNGDEPTPSSKGQKRDLSKVTTANPAAQLLPLLHCIATQTTEPISLPVGTGSSLTVQLSSSARTKR